MPQNPLKTQLVSAIENAKILDFSPKSSVPRVPRYRLHRASGQAVVTLSGRDHYLGRHGSPESTVAYQELTGRWLAGGMKPIETAPPAGLSVAEILLRYVEHAEQHYAARRRFKSIIHRIKASLRPVRELYGMTPAISFGPKALATVRNAMVNAGLTRSTINERVLIVRAAFTWAVAEELLPSSVSHGLAALKGLRRGDSAAKEPVKRRPVAREHVEAVLPHLRPPVRAMVQLLTLTGARPGEITAMRTGDIDTAGPVWVYRPTEHKTDQHGFEREIFIGPAAQEILRPWLRPNLTEYLFQPREDDAIRRAEIHAARQTPISCGNKPGSKPKSNKRKPGERYKPGAIAVAVGRACEAADVPAWYPYLIRHSFATRVRREHDVEAAQILLGHAKISTTQLYAGVNSEKAAAVVAKIG